MVSLRPRVAELDVITESLKETFRSRGLIRLERFLPADRVARAREVVMRALERHGCVQRGGLWTFGGVDQLPAYKASSRLRKGIKHTGAFRRLMTPVLLDAVDALADGAMDPASRKRQCDPGLLLSLPEARTWAVPDSLWHVDLPRLENRGVSPGVQMFACLDTVRPMGGGTVVVAGSHRVLDKEPWIGPSMKHAKRLRKLPYFRELMSKDDKDRGHFLSESCRVGDVTLQVVELHGEPGDVFLVDMRVLHTGAPNASRVPRIMLTQRFMLESVLEELLPARQAERATVYAASERPRQS